MGVYVILGKEMTFTKGQMSGEKMDKEICDLFSRARPFAEGYAMGKAAGQKEE